jgi:hypothetical protein
MVSRLVLRKPTIDQIWNRVRWDQELGIPGRLKGLTREPSREELETWAIQAGYDPVHYITAWVCQAEDARCPILLDHPENSLTDRSTRQRRGESEVSRPQDVPALIARLLYRLPKWPWSFQLW